MRKFDVVEFTRKCFHDACKLNYICKRKKKKMKKKKIEKEKHGNCSYETTQASKAVLFRSQNDLAKRKKKEKKREEKKREKKEKKKTRKRKKKKRKTIWLLNGYYETTQSKKAVLSRGQQVLVTPPRVAD